MSYAKQASKRKRRRKAVPVLGAAGLSLSLASGVAAATNGPSGEMPTQQTEVSYEITLAEEEVCDVSLATFYVFGKESVGTRHPRVRFAFGGACGCAGCGGCGCWTGTDYSASVLGNDAHPHRPIKPGDKVAPAPKRKRVPKNP